LIRSEVIQWNEGVIGYLINQHDVAMTECTSSDILPTQAYIKSFKHCYRELGHLCSDQPWHNKVPIANASAVPQFKLVPLATLSTLS